MNNFKELCVRCQLEQLITEREGMIALNQYRSMRGETQAYGEEHFLELQQKFANIEEEIRNT